MQKHFGVKFTIVFLLAAMGFTVAQDRISITLEGEFPVHPASRSLFNAPIASFNGKIYVAFVNRNLQTVVAQKKDGVWSESVVAPITQPDTWHNEPSIAVDSEGYIHVVYNMHSTPWQYSVSTNPEDISQWEFRGQYAGTNPGKSVASKSGCLGDCYDNWMSEGIADIPGNQITYPFMTPDRNGVLYVSYRECYYCDRSDYFAREWSGGISRYDVTTKTWSRVGGVRPFAHDPNYVPAAGGMHMFFDVNNRMHISWVWGLHYTKDEGSRSYFYNPNYPSYAYSDDPDSTFHKADGTLLTLPLDISQADVVVDPSWINPNSKGYFFGITNVAAMPNGNPFVFVWPRTQSQGVNRAWVQHIPGDGWSAPRLMPWGSTALLIDSRGNMITFSSGFRIHRSTDGGQRWMNYDIDLSDGPQIPKPDYSYFYQTDKIRVATTSNRGSNNFLKVWTIEFSSDGKSAVSPPEGLLIGP